MATSGTGNLHPAKYGDGEFEGALNLSSSGSWHGNVQGQAIVAYHPRGLSVE